MATRKTPKRGTAKQRAQIISAELDMEAFLKEGYLREIDHLRKRLALAEKSQQVHQVMLWVRFSASSGLGLTERDYPCEFWLFNEQTKTLSLYTVMNGRLVETGKLTNVEAVRENQQ